LTLMFKAKGEIQRGLADPFQAVHVRPEGGRDDDRAVLLLVIFQDGIERLLLY